ncbi:ATP-dependent zinc metalloprotease FtsH [subsurface metagenome]
MTASALAGELGLPLLVARMDGIITKYMGETSAKLRMIFEALKHSRGVYLFDEFDSIGTTRASGNDVGEMRRILNSFLQFMDEDNSESLILSATNHPGILDHALFRRFDDVIEYALPDKESRIRLLQNRLASYKKIEINWDKLADAASNISHADITRACDDAIKDMIIHDRNGITQKDILQMITERKILDTKHYNQNKQGLTTPK